MYQWDFNENLFKKLFFVKYDVKGIVEMFKGENLHSLVLPAPQTITDSLIN